MHSVNSWSVVGPSSDAVHSVAKCLEECVQVKNGTLSDKCAPCLTRHRISGWWTEVMMVNLKQEIQKDIMCILCCFEVCRV